MNFDRFDICEAHLAFEWDWNVSGVTQERQSNRRRNMSTDFQLSRMGFKPSPLFMGFESLTENGQDIYHNLQRRYKLYAHPSEADGRLVN